MKLPSKGKIIKTGSGDPARLYYVPIAKNVWLSRLTKPLALLGKNYSKILEIGCGSGILFPELKKRSKKVVGTDIHPYLNEVQKNFPDIDVRKENAEKLSFKNNTFDAVIGISVLEHLSNPEKGIKEIKRVLKPGGVGVFGYPIRTRLNDFVFWFLSHFNEHEEGDHKYYGQEITPILEKHFKIIKKEKMFPNIFQIIKVKK